MEYPCVLLRNENYIQHMIKHDVDGMFDHFDNGFLLGCEYHVEPERRFRETPPGNSEWKLISIHANFSEAMKAFDDLIQTDWPVVRDAMKANRIARRESKHSAPKVEKPHRQDKKQKYNGSHERRTMRLFVLERDGFKCRICGRSTADGVKLEVDHIYPVSKGGKTNPDNLWVLCFDCNRGKRDKIIPSIIEYSKSIQ